MTPLDMKRTKAGDMILHRNKVAENEFEIYLFRLNQPGIFHARPLSKIWANSWVIKGDFLYARTSKKRYIAIDYGKNDDLGIKISELKDTQLNKHDLNKSFKKQMIIETFRSKPDWLKS